MKISFRSIVLLVALFSLFTGLASSNAAAATKAKVTCSKIVKLRSVTANARGGTYIYKSNWNNRAKREMTYSEGNHAQKGAAFLVHYRSSLVPNSSSIEVRDAKCNLLGKMGRFPRCNFMGCGLYERWYFRTNGGSWQSVAKLAALAKKSGGSYTVYMQLKNSRWAKISSVYNAREQS